MKTCPKCKVKKPITEFYKDSLKKDGFQSQCKSCKAKQNSPYYQIHKVHKQRLNKVRKERNKRLMAEYLRDKQCTWEDCTINDPDMLVFDHLDQTTKKAGVGILVARAYSWEIIFAEMKKCRILCHNHHMKWTAKQLGWKRFW